MKQIFKKIFKVLGLSLAALALTLVAVLALVWLSPGSFIHTKNLERALPYLSKIGVELKWKSLDLSAQSLSWFRKRVHLSGRDFCVDYRAQNLHMCFEIASFGMNVSLKKLPFHYHIERARFIGGMLEMKPVSSRKESAPVTDKSSIVPRAPKFLERVEFDEITIVFNKMKIDLEESDFEGRVALSGSPAGKGSEWELSTHSRLVTEKEALPLSAEVRLRSEETLWFGPYRVAGSGEMTFQKGRKIHADIEGTPRGKNVVYTAWIDYKEGKRSFLGKVTGLASLEQFEGTINGSARGIVARLPQIDLEGCHVDYRVRDKEKGRKSLDVNCPTQLRTNFSKLDDATYKEMAETISVMLAAHLTIEDLPDRPGWVSGEIETRVDPLLKKVKHGDAVLKVAVDGKLSDFPKDWNFTGDGKLEIKEFQKLVEMTRQSPWAVPAPLNTLDGSVALTFSGKGKLDQGERSFPLKLTTRLSSKEQSLDLDGEGTIGLSKGPSPVPELDFWLALSDVRLVLPDLEKKAIPRLAPDKRIREKPTRTLASDKGSFKYRIEIFTHEGKPARFVSNLAEKEVPVNVRLVSSDEEPMYGTVKLSSFPIELYRRQGEVDHLSLRMVRKSDRREVDGEIKVFYTDYTIRVLVLGLAEAPEIKVVSEPPLPEDQALAVLLFGQPVDTLNQNEAASVGSTRAAIADRAISLASMYLLASTPVESVSYNPSSAQFSARLRLGDGTSLNVGTDMSELNQLGIRRRLGRHWTVSTYLEHPLDPIERTLSAFLEWSAGY